MSTLIGANAKTLVSHYFEMWNTGDSETAEEVVAADCVDHAHPEIIGPDGLRTAIELAHASNPLAHVFVDAVLGEGDMITVVGRITPPVSVGGELIGMVWTFRVPSTIQEIWTYTDPA